MRLFHVSKESDISVFEPRIPTRNDLDKSVGLVWAIDELRLPNFLTPRDCPRVTYNIAEKSSQSDIDTYFSSHSTSHIVIIESKWFERMSKTTLYLYEFDPSCFILQDSIAGYCIAKVAQKPIQKHKMDNLFTELFDRNVELRIVSNLWDIADEIKQTSLHWSLCKMENAQPK